MRRLYNVPVIGSTDVNNPQTLAQLKAWQPDIILSIYLNQLIKKEVINLPRQGTFNIHPALLPRHRGLFPYFWVIANGESETGVTIHWVDEKFDTGHLLLQKKLVVTPGETITALSYKCAVLGSDLLVEAIKLIEAGNPPRISQDSSQASYHSWPKPADQRRFRQQGGSYGTIFELWKHM
jgi:methionyl-tRNA formyltransferase